MADFAVLYRSGGTHHCTWTRILDAFSEENAAKARADMERMGYKALVVSFRQLMAVGMPIGWEYNSVDYDRDQVTIHNSAHGVPMQTIHIKAHIA